MSSKIIEFLRGNAKDHKGRSLDQIRALPDHRLDKEHDIIQWMFPSDIPSKHCKDAPVLSKEDIEIIKTDLYIQDAIQLSLFRMIRYYEKNDYWITQKNHNFLRITRILRCLWLVGSDKNGNYSNTQFCKYYVCLERILDDIFIDYTDIITEETFEYWKRANDDEFFKDKAKEPVERERTQLEREIEEAMEHRNPYDDDGDNFYKYI